METSIQSTAQDRILPLNRRHRQVLISAAVLILLIAPVTVYNYNQFGQFVLLNTNAGFAFFWGNHPIFGDRFVPVLTPEMGSYQALIPAELRGLNETAQDQALLKLEGGFITSDPVRFIKLSLIPLP